MHGKKIGSVLKGTNGEWFWVNLSQESWAEPLQGRDNVRGTGHATATAAVEAAGPWAAARSLD
jgi:hypothetical protein